MVPEILTFKEIDASNISLVGGKAANLGKMTRAGAPVPNGFVITTKCFWHFLEINNLKPELADLAQIAGQDNSDQLQTRILNLKDKIINAKFSLETINAIKNNLDQFADLTRFAVRSSATSEDLAQASFAGQYDTYLNVPIDQVINKIKECFASFWNERAFWYRAKNSIDHFAQGMAVVVQELINAESAGVLFTLNPLSGNEREMIIESCWGLGEALVSGEVSPDRFIIDPFAMRLINKQLAHKRIKLISKLDGDVDEIELDKVEANSASLNDEEIILLAKIAREIQRHYGHPIDIEWAKMNNQIFILQARPLTSITFSDSLGQWTSANFREVMPGLVNPLSFTLSLRYDYGNALAEFFQRLGFNGDYRNVAWSRRFFGRAFWNVEIVKNAIKILPGFNERAFDITVGIEPDYADDGITTPFNLASIINGLPILINLQWCYFTFWREAAAYEREFALIEKDLINFDYQRLSDEQLINKTKEMIDLHYRTNRIALICSFLATESQNDFRSFVEKINKRLPDDKKISIANLLTGLTQLSTTEPLVELWHLAAEARLDEQLKELICKTDVDQLIATLWNNRYYFAEKLNNYLQKFCFLAASDEDLSCPRWIDDATFPLTILKNFVEGDGGENPAQAIKKQQQFRANENARMLALLNWSERTNYKFQLQLVTRYCRWREITRISLSKTYYYCRRAFIEQGKRLAAKNIIADAEEIFWLEREELLDLLNDKINAEQAREKIATAHLIAECYRNIEPPTTIGKGSQIKREAIIQSSNEKLFQGVACSAGEIVARARIIQNLSEAGKLSRGEILIAPHTNPGWTPLFSLAAAVVLEEGGLLSHGAVVARECGIPTVLQIKGATKIFNDGQLLRVNGTNGEVEVLVE